MIKYPKKSRKFESEILSVFSPKILDEKFGACDKIYIRYPTKAVFFQCGTSLKTQTQFIPFISQSTIIVYGTFQTKNQLLHRFQTVLYYQVQRDRQTIKVDRPNCIVLSCFNPDTSNLYIIIKQTARGLCSFGKNTT